MDAKRPPVGYLMAAQQVCMSLGAEWPQLLLSSPGPPGLCAHPVLPGQGCRLLVPAFFCTSRRTRKSLKKQKPPEGGSLQFSHHFRS